MEQPKTHFKNLVDSTTADWKVIDKSYEPIRSTQGKRLLDTLRGLKFIQGALPIDRFEHSLQAATRAHSDGRSDEYVFTVLLHDIGAYLTMHNHAEVSASILKAYVSPELYWMILHHDDFEAFHYFDKIGLSPNLRDQYEGHPNYAMTEEFCRLYDSPSWDSAFQSKPLEFFLPIVERIILTGKLK